MKFLLVVMMILLFPAFGFSGLSHENGQDREIFEEGLLVAAKLLSKNSESKGGAALVKFLMWMDSSNKTAKEMNVQLVFSEPITAKAGGSEKKLAEKILSRSDQLKSELSKRLLYIYVATQLDSSNAKGKQLLSEMNDMAYDLNFKNLLKKADKLKMVDLSKIAAQKAEDKRLNEAAEKEQKKAYKDDNKVSKADIEKLLDSVKFKAFTYSESSILNAVNLLTHKLYWRGVQFTIKGKRISVSSETTTSNGAVYYHGPLWQPQLQVQYIREKTRTSSNSKNKNNQNNKTESQGTMELVPSNGYILKNKTIREILAHMQRSMSLDYTVEDGEVVIHDGKLGDFHDAPENGFDAGGLLAALKSRDIKTTKKYRGKVVPMNGIITGYGTHNHDTIFISMDGGFVRLHISKSKLDAKIYNRIEKRVKAWKSNGGLKAYRERLREIKDNDEDVMKEDIVSPDVFLSFEATCKGMDRDRLIFEDPVFAFIEETSESLINIKKGR